MTIPWVIERINTKKSSSNNFLILKVLKSFNSKKFSTLKNLRKFYKKNEKASAYSKELEELLKHRLNANREQQHHHHHHHLFHMPGHHHNKEHQQQNEKYREVSSSIDEPGSVSEGSFKKFKMTVGSLKCVQDWVNESEKY